MAFTGINDVIAAADGGRDVILSKTTLGGQLAGFFTSYWLGAGLPAAGAIPGAAAVCNSALLGAMARPTKTALQNRAILWSSVSLSVFGTTYVMDRLAHMGGLNGTLTTAQTVSVDVSGGTNDLPARIGPADYLNVRWFLEWFASTGGTAVNATVAVTYSDNSTGNIVIAVGTTYGINRMLEIRSTNGLGIKSVQSVTLSATTGAAGNFGVVAMREIAIIPCAVANIANVLDWAALRLVPISDDACLTLISLNSSTTCPAVSGTLRMGVA